MPYKTIEDLPDSVKGNLPKKAQEIFMGAYNGAHEYYKDPSKRTRGGTLEETANSVAWSAVKHKFAKNERGHWVELPDDQ